MPVLNRKTSLPVGFTSIRSTVFLNNPYYAKSYAHPDDLFYDYPDDFWDYEDAEDYWEEHNDY